MKLYTEEQVKKMLFRIDDFVYPEHAHDKVLSEHTPIELPTNEEIEELSKDVIVYNDTKRGWFKEGAKWMRDKLLVEEDKTLK